MSSVATIVVAFDRVLMVSAEDNTLLNNATASVKLLAGCCADMITSFFSFAYIMKYAFFFLKHLPVKL